MRKRAPRRKAASPYGGIALLLRRSHEQERLRALARPLDGDEQGTLMIPARISAERLRAGEAELLDLHNVAAFINVGVILARDIGETEACDAIQAGTHAIAAVKDRGGPRYAMNAAQREAILQAVDLTDELMQCATLLEIATAHQKLMQALPMTGELRSMEMEVC